MKDDEKFKSVIKNGVLVKIPKNIKLGDQMEIDDKFVVDPDYKISLARHSDQTFRIQLPPKLLSVDKVKRSNKIDEICLAFISLSPLKRIRLQFFTPLELVNKRERQAPTKLMNDVTFANNGSVKIELEGLKNRSISESYNEKFLFQSQKEFSSETIFLKEFQKQQSKDFSVVIVSSQPDIYEIFQEPNKMAKAIKSLDSVDQKYERKPRILLKSDLFLNSINENELDLFAIDSYCLYVPLVFIENAQSSYAFSAKSYDLSKELLLDRTAREIEQKIHVQKKCGNLDLFVFITYLSAEWSHSITNVNLARALLKNFGREIPKVPSANVNNAPEENHNKIIEDGMAYVKSQVEVMKKIAGYMKTSPPEIYVYLVHNPKTNLPDNDNRKILIARYKTK